MIKVCNLYSQYQTIPDRRVQSRSVENERRSGVDRRAVNRIRLDNKLNKDIFELRSSVSDFNKKNAVSFERKTNFLQKVAETFKPFNNKELNSVKNTTVNDVKAAKSNGSPSGLAEEIFNTVAPIVMGFMAAVAGPATVIGVAAHTAYRSVEELINLAVKK